MIYSCNSRVGLTNLFSPLVEEPEPIGCLCERNLAQNTSGLTRRTPGDDSS